MTKIVPTTVKNIVIQDLIVIGKRLSTVSTSFEKRFIILPKGVVSKKDIGRRKEWFNNLLWRNLAAFRQPMAKTTDPTNNAIACPTPKAP